MFLMSSTPTSSHPRLSAFILLVFALACTPGLFVAGLWAYAGIGGAIILFVSLTLTEKAILLPNRTLGVFALAVLAVVAAETLASDYANISWREWLKLLTIFLPLLVLSSPSLPISLLHKNFFPLALIAVTAAALALGLELKLGGPLLQAVHGQGVSLTQYNRGLSLMMVLAFPLMAGFMFGPFPLAKSKRLWIIVFFMAVLLVPAGLTESRTAKLAFVVALLTSLIAFLSPLWARRGMMLLPALGTFWPYAVQQVFLHHYESLSRLPDSWRARVEIWDYLSYRIQEHLLIGWGIGTSHKLDFAQPHGDMYVLTKAPAAHPHNVFMQLWVELGLPGLALGIGFAWIMLVSCASLDKRLQPYALGAWMAAFVLCLFGYNFWTDTLFACFALSGFVFLMLDKKLKAEAV